MSRTLAVVAALAAHAGLTAFVAPYRELVLAAGSLLSHGHDIADIPRLALVGFVATAIPIVAVAAIAAGVFGSNRNESTQ
ncbi:MAG TPA: hypothetical protein VEU08_08415 [Vicinamibacterales bacterium]|nr:hypothetical protein [Vicinamibacterales bacterium]